MADAFSAALFAFCIFTSCLQPSLGSYLGYPRIHFAGQFRADVNTRNNVNCNYRTELPVDPDKNEDFRQNGTEEFQFINTYVTAAVDSSGVLSTKDPVVGQNIIGNLDGPFAKISDLDVDWQTHSTVYGLKFGIQWTDELKIPANASDLAFFSDWTPTIISHNAWSRMKCYRKGNSNHQLYEETFPKGCQSSTILTGVDWMNDGDSPILKQMRQMANGGNLTVRISLNYYTRNYPPYVAKNASLGYVLGVIGVPSPDDTLNVPGQRSMVQTQRLPVGLSFKPNDLCYNKTDKNFTNIHKHDLPWMFTSPFEVDYERNEVRFDLSNSIPTNISNSLRDLGTLRLGMYQESGSTQCVYLLGNLSDSGIPYISTDDLPVTSGIYSVEFHPSLASKVNSSLMVIAQVVEGSNGSHPICGDSRSQETGHIAQVLLEEKEYFVRPTGYYYGRIDRNTTSSHELLITKYGNPVQGVNVQLQRVDQSERPPENGIVPTSWNSTTDNNGRTTFEFVVKDHIPLDNRNYKTQQCNNSNPTHYLPIDGQVYLFAFCANECDYIDQDNLLSFLGFSDVPYVDNPTWVDNVGPIFKQYAHLTPIMTKLLNLSNFAEVTQPNNINMLKMTLNLDFNDPSYMPTTRDLSPAKRDMILRWLENHIYDSTNKTHVVPLPPVCIFPPTAQIRVLPPEHCTYPRCKGLLNFDDRPGKDDAYFDKLYSPFSEHPDYMMSADHKQVKAIKGRPLFHACTADKDKLASICTKANISEQLQSAVQLEWATIPTYLTSLYSIVDGCNTEIYNMTLSIIIQEMLHMTQSANILIAMGGSPLIDHKNVTPTFPTHLPAGVLPRLVVHLKKLSLQHIYNTFMAIEVPEITVEQSYTIGAFYKEISCCIDYVKNVTKVELFDKSTLPRQVKWPWPPGKNVGSVIPINDSLAAIKGITEIVTQGEGQGILLPEQIGTGNVAHFFKFEEIVCQHKLQEKDNKYAYTGANVNFEPKGVWPMRDDPLITDLLPHTNCYTESRVFHATYRKLLRKLQEVFNGHPDGIFDAIQLMKSLEAHGKRLMWIKLRPESPTDDRTCGPVWEYDWPQNQC